jgi:uncharacterized protein
MLLAREFVTYLSHQLVDRHAPTTFEATDPQAAYELIHGIIVDELSAEDKLNEEVRQVLEEYSEYMRREQISYMDMFRRIKNTLLQQRKIVRASGRDTGDQMKLSRDKLTDISHKIVAAMKKSRSVRIKKDANEVRLKLLATMTEILQMEEKVDKAARTKVRSMKKDIPEGSEEFDLMHRRYYAEELKKLGIDLAK